MICTAASQNAGRITSDIKASTVPSPSFRRRYSPPIGSGDDVFYRFVISL
jgi:hypothetical protein